MLLVLAAALACGNGATKTPPASGSMSGNWQFTLTRHSNLVPETFSGFLQQQGDSVTGSFILGAGCSGVGPVSGTLAGQNLQLDVNEFGQDLSLTGTLPSGAPSPSTFISGEFSTLSGGCMSFPSTGTWSAIQVQPIAGAFHGTLALSSQMLNVTGTLTQGPNTGSSNAGFSGSITAAGAPNFCAYLTSAAITGQISGTGAILNLYGPDGSPIGQIGNPGTPALVSQNGSSLSGEASFSQISKSCTGDSGQLQITFP